MFVLGYMLLTIIFGHDDHMHGDNKVYGIDFCDRLIHKGINGL
jgi:hypothetical protein